MANTDFEARLAFAKQNLNLEWKRVIFCSQTQINGIGVVGLMTQYGLGDMIFSDHINTSVQYVNEIKKMVAPVVHQRDDFIFANEVNGFPRSEQFLEWLHNQTNFVVLNLPSKSHDINPINNVWNQIRSHFEGSFQSRVMESEIMNYWYLLRDDVDYVEDLYLGMKTRMCEVIQQIGSLIN